MSGVNRRMSRLFPDSKRPMISVPIDHGMQVGAVDGITDPVRLIGSLADAGVDSLIVNPGMLSQHGALLERIPSLILRMDQTTMWRTGGPFGYEGTHTRLITDVNHAVELGADAVITYLFTCTSDPLEETKCFENNARINKQCRQFGMPHIIEAMAANGGFANADDPEVVSMNCRIAGELGADVIKTDWCGASGVARIASQSLAPVCIAGGAATGNIQDLTTIATQCAERGARGLFFGRNVFQRSNIVATIAALRKALA
jgi:DhnA family fructose-bisphosphate aldolase class Ia